MNYKLIISENALEDLNKHKKSGNKKLLRKLEVLLTELMQHPREGTGKPEKLKYNLEGLYSRRINKEHRLIYQINDDVVTVLVLSAYSHYGDK